ncbi:MAG: hypothetical protein HC925_01840 [Coleofasciculaceae cyanobacterium SM2_3_26]|nr:hypothetical protein [Coleofasciculaceae cyanobacterium SM2_3_26]
MPTNGTQSYGIQTFDNYETTPGAWRTYRIAVGDFLTGQQLFLTLANDRDVANPNALSQYRNLRLFEGTGSTSGSTGNDPLPDPLPDPLIDGGTMADVPADMPSQDVGVVGDSPVISDSGNMDAFEAIRGDRANPTNFVEDAIAVATSNSDLLFGDAPAVMWM